MARSTLAKLVSPLILAAAAWAQPGAGAPGADAALKQAGVCSRCHVAQVLEWSASKHVRATVACQTCHGPSAGHVANERNEVKPDRLPRESAIAGSCAACHSAGCPKTRRADACQTCHHQHALVDPRAKAAPAADPPEAVEYRRRMAAGEALIRATKWREARAEFAAALRARPGDRAAMERERMCARRIDPSLPGFRAVGPDIDDATGLPLRVRVDLLGTEMQLVRGGDFDMGSDARPGSSPAHTVRVRTYYLARRELTQREWALVDGTGPGPRQSAEMPVHGVSWDDAVAWIAKLNARVAGGGFRLPSEAEWEFAARGTAPESAWTRANSRSVEPAAGRFAEVDAYSARPVGTRAPNAAGFFDLLGNVAEWTSSVRRPYPYSASDGREAAFADGQRVIRGGSYVSSPDEVEATVRHSDRAGRRNPWNGFRLARSAPK